MEKLDTVLRSFEREDGISRQGLDNLIAFAASPLPADYLDLLKFSNGASGWLRERYLVIYSADEVISINRFAKMETILPNMIIFGSNGGGTSFLLELGQSNLSTIYRCEDVDLGNESLIRISSSMESFLDQFGPQVGRNQI